MPTEDRRNQVGLVAIKIAAEIVAFLFPCERDQESHAVAGIDSTPEIIDEIRTPKLFIPKKFMLTAIKILANGGCSRLQGCKEGRSARGPQEVWLRIVRAAAL